MPILPRSIVLEILQAVQVGSHALAIIDWASISIISTAGDTHAFFSIVFYLFFKSSCLPLRFPLPRETPINRLRKKS